MGSWPVTEADWLTLELRAGENVCVVHGRVTAAAGSWQLPICPHCRQLVSIVRADPRSGAVRSFAEPRPAYCANAERHPLAPGRFLLASGSCQCAGALPGPGTHRTWKCLAEHQGATIVQSWPPHSAELQ